MRVLAISGSLRAHSSNTALLQAVSRIAPPGLQLVLFQGLRELPHFDPDLDAEGQEPPPAVARLREQVSAADGLIICSPEYAHGVPGALKNALDWLVSDPDFVGKPVLLWNASAAGGGYAQASLLETLRTMSARVLEKACLLEPFLKKRIAADGQLPEDAARALRSSLAALAAAVEAASGAKARAGQ